VTIYTEEHQELRATVRRLLEKSADRAAVRATIDGLDAYDQALWARMSAELGLAGLAIAESRGGSGFGVLELSVVLEEIGRANLPSPYLSTVLAGLALTLADADDTTARLLSGIASGERIAAVHLDTGDIRKSRGVEPSAAGHVPGGPIVGEQVLNGTARHVLDGPTADELVLIGPGEGSVVDLGGDGVTVRRLAGIDLTRSHAHVTFDGAAARPITVGGDWKDRVAALAAVLLACEQIGGAERVLEISTCYATDRIQFGRPIGSFQAVKHTLADMLIELELARAIQQDAVRLAATGAPLAELMAAASTAKVACSQAFVQLTSDMIRVHGGIGFTWEHEAHLYFRRARASARLFGDVSAHSDRIAAHVGL
jgi:alkylation response protein AidB-like acyl-CoA dehydrogenase